LQKTKRLKKTDVPRAARRKRPTLVPKRRSRDDILNRIVEAANKEFKRCGFAGTTTATIAREAGVTEAQLFRYFGSKTNLFRETVFNPINQHFLNFIDKHMPDGVNVGNEALTNLYTFELQRFISEHSDLLTSLVVAQKYENGAAHGVGHIDSLRTYFDRAASLMSMRLKGKPNIDPKLLVRVTFVTVLASVMFKEWIFPADLASDQQISAAVNNFIIAGLSANAV
jgi:AcrR family transcriptional regulator